MREQPFHLELDVTREELRSLLWVLNKPRTFTALEQKSHKKRAKSVMLRMTLRWKRA